MSNSKLVPKKINSYINLSFIGINLNKAPISVFETLFFRIDDLGLERSGIDVLKEGDERKHLLVVICICKTLAGILSICNTFHHLLCSKEKLHLTDSDPCLKIFPFIHNCTSSQYLWRWILEKMKGNMYLYLYF